jgi:hypothetical protein
MTPEGRVKQAVKQVLIRHRVYYHMPVQNGMGAPTLDFNGCHKGLYFSIETKAPGGSATPRQRNTMGNMIGSGASVFFIDSPGCDDMLALLVWLTDPKPATVGPGVHKQMLLTADTIVRAHQLLNDQDEHELQLSDD